MLFRRNTDWSGTAAIRLERAVSTESNTDTIESTIWVN